MSSLDRGPSKDASYQVLIHLAWRFQRRRFKNKSANQKQELPVTAIFRNRSRQNNNLYKGHSIDDSYQISVHLDEGLQRGRLKWEKLMDDGRQVMAKAHVAFGMVS